MTVDQPTALPDKVVSITGQACEAVQRECVGADGGVPGTGHIAVKGTILLALLVLFVLQTGCSTQRGKVANSIEKRVDLPENSSGFRNRFYAGASIGSTSLDPDLSEVSFTLQKDNAVGTQLKLGYDLHNLFSVELDTSVLGAAELESSAEVEYTSFAVSGMIYGLTGVGNRSRREKWSAFARLGYAYNNVASNVVTLDNRDLSSPVFGLGVEYGFSNGLGLRAEATRFHDEAVYASLGAVFRFGEAPSLVPSVFSASSDDADRNEVRRQAGTAVAQPAQYARRTIIASADDIDADGVGNGADECANTPAGTSVASNGCGLFDGVVEGISFGSGSARLDDAAKQILGRLAVKLMAFPEVRVAVKAHTDDKGPESINQSVSETRARSVVAFLVKNGVGRDQLEPMGMGESQPRIDNATEQGRLSNRRIELVTLPDLNLAPTHVTELGSDAGSVNRLAAKKKSSGKLAKQPKSATAIAKNDQAKKSQEPALGAAVGAAVANVKTPAIKPLPKPGLLPGGELSGIVKGVGFEPGSPELTAQSGSSLDKIAASLKQHSKARIAIMAHTDDQGSAESNLDLSTKRAESVAKYLKSQGIAASRLEVEGYGEALPVAQNLTEQDRSRNRRIELRVLTN